MNNLTKAFVAVRISLLLTLFFSAAVICAAEEVGTSRITENATFAGISVEPGVYTFEILENDDGSYIQISNAGKPIAKDLAIVIPARDRIEKPEIQIVPVSGSEFLRIRIRYEKNWYFAYMQSVAKTKPQD
ncbi:MAG: hypothetical protein C5B54_02010 [Acidobacteria bacterium]|nr:MAG: hypothetical protein C5B54_02010 [Acidobacteriota bacterium]